MDERQDQPDSELDTTLDRDADLDELRDGGPAQTPVTTTMAPAGATGRAASTAGRKPRPGAAPTTGDATTGGMNTPTGMGTSDAESTGQVGGAPSAASDGRADRKRDRDRADRS
jgi:hypothetical protein